MVLTEFPEHKMSSFTDRTETVNFTHPKSKCTQDCCPGPRSKERWKDEEKNGGGWEEEDRISGSRFAFGPSLAGEGICFRIFHMVILCIYMHVCIDMYFFPVQQF